MRALIILFAVVSGAVALRAQRFSKLETPESYKQASDVFNNLPNFYYYLRFTQSFEQYEYFCQNLMQELDRFQTVRELYFAMKVLKELRCKLVPQNLAIHLKRVEDKEKNSSDASHLFRMMVMVQTPLEQIIGVGCNRFTKYIFGDSSKVRRTDSKMDIPSWDGTARMLRDLAECGVVSPEFKDFTQKMASHAARELVDVTKDQSAWPTENTLYDTIDILISILDIDKEKLSKEKLERAVKFISANLGNDLSLKEKNKWNQLLSKLDKLKIQVLEVPTVFDFNGCEDTCYLPIVGLPSDSRVSATIGGRQRQFRVQKTNIVMSDSDDLKSATEATFTIENPEFHLIPSKFTIKLRQVNKILLTRFLVNTQNAPTNLLDSDETDCANVGLAGNEGTYLHVGFRLKNEENFAFVQLEPHASELEGSAMVHAEFRPEDKIYVATLDFSDYETIRPNSGTYNIWLTVGGVRRQCGQITLTFTNLEKSLKDNLTKAYPVELTNVPTFKIEDERFYFSGLYFTIATVIFGVAYWMTFQRVKQGLEEEVVSPFWQTVFFAGLAWHVATLFRLLLAYKLIDRFYWPLAELGVLTYLFKKAFLRAPSS